MSQHSTIILYSYAAHFKCAISVWWIFLWEFNCTETAGWLVGRLIYSAVLDAIMRMMTCMFCIWIRSLTTDMRRNINYYCLWLVVWLNFLYFPMLFHISMLPVHEEHVGAYTKCPGFIPSWFGFVNWENWLWEFVSLFDIGWFWSELYPHSLILSWTIFQFWCIILQLWGTTANENVDCCCIE